MNIVFHKIQDWQFVFFSIAIAIAINLILKIKRIYCIGESILNDTLKRLDKETGQLKWSSTKLTMLISFISVIWAFFYVILNDKTDYSFRELVFTTVAIIAGGIKITDAFSKRLLLPKQ